MQRRPHRHRDAEQPVDTEGADDDEDDREQQDRQMRKGVDETERHDERRSTCWRMRKPKPDHERERDRKREDR